MILLTVENMLFKYSSDNKFELKCESFYANKSELTCVLGANGCGKSTLLSIMCGFLIPNEGEVTLDGEHISELPKKILRSFFAWIDSSLYSSFAEDLLVVDHLMLGAKYSGSKIPLFYRRMNPAFIRQEFDLSSDISEILVEKYYHKVSQMSAGQRQMLGMALAPLKNRKVLLCDESTSNLDLIKSRRFFDRVKVAASGYSIASIVVTHDIMLAAEYSDNIYVIVDGVVTQLPIEDASCSDRLDLLRKIFVS